MAWPAAWSARGEDGASWGRPGPPITMPVCDRERASCRPHHDERQSVKLSFENIPQSVTTHLTRAQRSYLCSLSREFPDFQRLLSQVIDKGIAAIAQEATGLTPAEKVEAKRKSETPAVAPSFVTGKRRLVASSKPHPEQVENHLTFSIDGRTQERLQDFLDAQPQASLEDACLTLLQLGLHHAESDLREVRRSVVIPKLPPTPSEKAEAMTHLAERLWLRSKTLCGF